MVVMVINNSFTKQNKSLRILQVVTLFAFILQIQSTSCLQFPFLPPGSGSNRTILQRIFPGRSASASASEQPASSINKISSTTGSLPSLSSNNKNNLSKRTEPSPSPPTMSLRAWTCHGKSQRDMVEKLNLAGIVKSNPVKEALIRVDRSNYAVNPTGAFMDAPQPIGHGQTISAPHMHSHALEEILPTLTKFSREIQQQASILARDDGDTQEEEKEQELKILDVGCGSGYLTAAFGRLVDRSPDGPGPIAPLTKGKVYGIDVIPKLVEMSRQNIVKADEDLLQSGTVTLAIGDGWKGLPNEAPFHAIHVGAAAERFPASLMMQLNPRGGCMIIPVGSNGSIQNLYKIERVRDNSVYNKDDFKIQNLLGVRYVPLVHP